MDDLGAGRMERARFGLDAHSAESERALRNAGGCEAGAMVSNVKTNAIAQSIQNDFDRRTSTMLRRVGQRFLRDADDLYETCLIDVQTGTLSLTGGGTSTGAFTAAAVLDFGGGTHDLNAGSRNSLRNPIGVFAKAFLQAGKLRPVCVQANAEHSNLKSDI
jgi:hypothetical protein